MPRHPICTQVEVLSSQHFFNPQVSGGFLRDRDMLIISRTEAAVAPSSSGGVSPKSNVGGENAGIRLGTSASAAASIDDVASAGGGATASPATDRPGQINPYARAAASGAAMFASLPHGTHSCAQK